MAGTSAESPVTESERTSWPGAGWLRVALIAGIAAGLVAAAFNLGVAERVVDEAIALESTPASAGSGEEEADASHTHVGVVAEPFTRGEQKGGMIIGQGIVGLALGLLLAGAALMLGKGSLTPQRLWLTLVAVGAWVLLVLPALKYPPLPPGVETALQVEDRQINYLLLVLAGAGGALLASAVWTRLAGEGARSIGALGPTLTRVVATGLVLVVPVAIAFIVLPGDSIATSVDSGLLARFRIVSIASQTLFWVVLATLGLWLLEHRRLPLAVRRRIADA